MQTKCTMLIQVPSVVSDADAPMRRIGGFSESWYDSQVSPNEVRLSFQALCTLRARLLPIGASIVGQRYQVVDPTGASSTTAVVYPGASGIAADVPQMALLCRATGLGVRNVRQVIIRGLPDARVVEGEYTPSQVFTTALTAYFALLRADSWRFRGRDLAAVQTPIFTASAGGEVITESPHGLAVGAFVRVLRTQDAAGNLLGVRTQVTAVPSPSTLILLPWALGATTGGKIRLDAVVYPAVDTVGISRVITRRVGRPFTQYRGRR